VFTATPWTDGSQAGNVHDVISRTSHAGFRILNAKRRPPKKTSKTVQSIAVRRAGSGNEYELVYPHSVERRAADMEEVRNMLAAGEIDVAEDELRWLVGGCPVLLDAHKLLGQIAAGDGKWELARGHFGFAYELGLAAAKDARPPATLPCARPANRDLHEAARGLVESLLNLGERELAQQVIAQILAWDPTDPTGVKELGNHA
jgi:hypothetical protein